MSQLDKQISIAQIVAISSNRCIGKNNDLPWHISEDLKHFKRMTTNADAEGAFKGIMVMGRKTFESMRSKPLPNRVNIIITRQTDYASTKGITDWVNEGKIIIVYSLDAAIDVAKQQAKQLALDTVWVIGGGDIFAQAMPITSRIELTEVDVDIVDGDAFYPTLPSDFIQTNASQAFVDDKTKLAYRFLTFTRACPKSEL